jgi:hypothetical protein
MVIRPGPFCLRPLFFSPFLAVVKMVRREDWLLFGEVAQRVAWGRVGCRTSAGTAKKMGGGDAVPIAVSGVVRKREWDALQPCVGCREGRGSGRNPGRSARVDRWSSLGVMNPVSGINTALNPGEAVVSYI